MINDWTVRRVLGFLGGFVVILVAVSAGVSIVHTQADLYTTGPAREGHIDASDPVTPLSDLPAGCRRFARSLAAGQNRSLDEYRIGVGPITIRLRQTPQTGWVLSDETCATPLSSITHLQVDTQTYHVEGHYHRSNLHQLPAFRGGQLVGALFGVGLLLYGFRDLRQNKTE